MISPSLRKRIEATGYPLYQLAKEIGESYSFVKRVAERHGDSNSEPQGRKSYAIWEKLQECYPASEQAEEKNG